MYAHYPKIATMLLALSVVLSFCQAATLHVNNMDGDDTADGHSAETAYKTLARAVPQCKPGDILSLVATGKPYRESIAFRGAGGTPADPIIVEGNGAVLSGLVLLPTEKWEPRENGAFFFPAPTSGARRPFLVIQGKRVDQVGKIGQLGPGLSHWRGAGVIFVPEAGKSIADYEISGTMLSSGFVLSGGGYITVRNLVCEYFSNDGFNIHGSCQGLIFENITGRWNGDDGFSVHEDVGAVVRGGHFHHNNYGIQDVSLSRSMFYGVLVENNRVHGVDLIGGVRSLVDSVVRGNARCQVRISSGAPCFGLAKDDPLSEGTVYLRNVLILGGTVGLLVEGGGQASALHCTISGSALGVSVGATGNLHFHCGAVVGCSEGEVVNRGGRLVTGANVFHPGRFQHDDIQYAPEEFAAFREALGTDSGSVISSPSFDGPGSFVLSAPRLTQGNRQILPGIPQLPILPFPLGNPQNELATGDATQVSPGMRGGRYDFEKDNPWGRIYPTPAKGVVHKAELSSEQAVSGTQSVKWSVTFPPDAGRKTWHVKFFSVKFPYARPVRALRAQIYGDGSGASCYLRIRDRTGECFCGPTFKLDWTGWREVGWDLSKTPPRRIFGGDGNKTQDTPTTEIVFEATFPVPLDGTPVILYADDLQVDLEE